VFAKALNRPSQPARREENKLEYSHLPAKPEPDMRSLTPLSPSILALCFGVLAPVVQAEPQVSIRLNGQQLQPSWETLADDRFAAELELPEGILQLGDDRADGQPLKPFQRQELNSASRFDYQVTRPGRYRLLIQTGDDANLRLLPVRQGERSGRTGVPSMERRGRTSAGRRCVRKRPAPA